MTSLRRLVVGLMVISLLAVLGAAVAGAAEDGPSLRDPSEFPTSDEGEDGAAAFDGTIVTEALAGAAEVCTGPMQSAPRPPSPIPSST